MSLNAKPQQPLNKYYAISTSPSIEWGEVSEKVVNQLEIDLADTVKNGIERARNSNAEAVTLDNQNFVLEGLKDFLKQGGKTNGEIIYASPTFNFPQEGRKDLENKEDYSAPKPN